MEGSMGPLAIYRDIGSEEQDLEMLAEEALLEAMAEVTIEDVLNEVLKDFSGRKHYMLEVTKCDLILKGLGGSPNSPNCQKVL
jgi:hypothetical protein